MKFNCLQDEFSRFLQVAVRAIATKSTLPILTGILLETKDNYLRCLATDLEIAVEVKINNLQIIKPGAVVVSGKTFVEIIRHLPQTTVDVELDENSKMLQITSQHASYQIPTLPVEEFPALPELAENEAIEVNGDSLKEAIRQTIYATLADDPRPFLSSILWEISPNQLRMVATDVNRIAVKDLPVKGGSQGTALVPVRSLREMAAIFGGFEDEGLQIYFNEKLIFVVGKGITFSSRLIEAQFPRYEQVIPKDYLGSFVVNRSEFIQALERTSLVSTSVKIQVQEPNLIMTSKEPDRGRSYEEVKIDFSGKELEIGFNARFLLDFLKATGAERITGKYVQEQKPVLLQGEGEDGYMYVVAPLKLTV